MTVIRLGRSTYNMIYQPSSQVPFLDRIRTAILVSFFGSAPCDMTQMCPTKGFSHEKMRGTDPVAQIHHNSE
jgi:hypothetical protein